MTKIDINNSLTKIEIFWNNITKEKSDDPAVYDYISTHAMALKMIAFNLKGVIENEILKDKEAKIKLQKLQRTLENIDEKLDFKIQINKTQNYIDDILTKLSLIKDDIEILNQYY